MAESSRPVYPPPLPPAQLSALMTHAIDWALSHGLSMRALMPSADGQSLTLSGHQALHLPFALFPSPYPRAHFERVINIQPIWNTLVHRISRDHDFLCSVIDEVAPVDDYTGKVYEIYKQVHAEGRTLDVDLGLHRSDYMVHTDGDGSVKALFQVEINTISSSFSHLSTRVGELHRYLSRRLDFFNSPDLPSPDIRLDQLPNNSSSRDIPLGLARAHELYSADGLGLSHTGSFQSLSQPEVKSNIPKAVLMVCQPAERNAFDQRGIEHILWDEHEVKLVRGTLEEVASEARLLGSERRLVFRDHEISVVYYRAGYTPNDYPTAACWDARLLLERARAVKCPSAAYHLVGTKKMQQVLAGKGVVEKFIPDPAQASALRQHMTGLYPLDGSAESEALLLTVLTNPQEYVLKPQREGGGNNFYGATIPTHIASLTPIQRRAYILMDRIRPPVVKTVMVREGKTIQTGCVSELGVYGIWVSQGGVAGKDDGVVVLNKDGGYLLRTKSNESDEGGVAAGFAVVDTIFNLKKLNTRLPNAMFRNLEPPLRALRDAAADVFRYQALYSPSVASEHTGSRGAFGTSSVDSNPMDRIDVDEELSRMELESSSNDPTESEKTSSVEIDHSLNRVLSPDTPALIAPAAEPFNDLTSKLEVTRFSAVRDEEPGMLVDKYLILGRNDSVEGSSRSGGKVEITLGSSEWNPSVVTSEPGSVTEGRDDGINKKNRPATLCGAVRPLTFDQVRNESSRSENKEDGEERGFAGEINNVHRDEKQEPLDRGIFAEKALNGKPQAEKPFLVTSGSISNSELFSQILQLKSENDTLKREITSLSGAEAFKRVKRAVGCQSELRGRKLGEGGVTDALISVTRRLKIGYPEVERPRLINDKISSELVPTESHATALVEEHRITAHGEIEKSQQLALKDREIHSLRSQVADLTVQLEQLRLRSHADTHVMRSRLEEIEKNDAMKEAFEHVPNAETVLANVREEYQANVEAIKNERARCVLELNTQLEVAQNEADRMWHEREEMQIQFQADRDRTFERISKLEAELNDLRRKGSNAEILENTIRDLTYQLDQAGHERIDTAESIEREHAEAILSFQTMLLSLENEILHLKADLSDALSDRDRWRAEKEVYELEEINAARKHTRAEKEAQTENSAVSSQANVEGEELAKVSKWFDTVHGKSGTHRGEVLRNNSHKQYRGSLLESAKGLINDERKVLQEYDNIVLGLVETVERLVDRIEKIRGRSTSGEMKREYLPSRVGKTLVSAPLNERSLKKVTWDPAAEWGK
ncbi:hypothetical protein HDU93_001199 [Gonapodya sp. JEL0774]|nr:hypothetical protein HDU93_001199 [Gonapodya sp. JEL0774]